MALNMVFGTRSVSRHYRCYRPTFPLLSEVPGFVNAQYRFVMNPAGDYTVHFADPDMYVSLTGLQHASLIDKLVKLFPVAGYPPGHHQPDIGAGRRG
jgi:hypothetical protein